MLQCCKKAKKAVEDLERNVGRLHAICGRLKRRCYHAMAAEAPPDLAVEVLAVDELSSF